VIDRPWQSHYDDGVPSTLAYPDVPLHAFLDETARHSPDAVATIFFDATLTYRELSREADAFAAGLQTLGVRKGDRVALILPNCPQYVIAFYGALRAGAAVVPCNPLYTAPELRHQLADAGAAVAVVLSHARGVRWSGVSPFWAALGVLNLALAVLVFVILDRGRSISPAYSRLSPIQIARLRAMSTGRSLAASQGD